MNEVKRTAFGLWVEIEDYTGADTGGVDRVDIHPPIFQ